MSGKQWRGIAELENGESFRRFLEAEFPALAPLAPDRRLFLKLMGASLALAGLSGCDDPPDEAIPYVEQPENVIPGVPRFYATAVMLDGYAQPVLGETHEGRPTKLEGNPDHPASGGRTDAFTQAAVLQLYDPDRSRVPLHLGSPASWGAFEAEMLAATTRLAQRDGAGLCVLTGAVTSPTLARLIAALQTRYPRARWHAFEPIGVTLRHESTTLAFGRPLDMRLLLEGAETIVSLDDDLLGPGPWQVWNARGWAARRRAARKGEGASRLYVTEPTPSLTGTVATSRLPVAPWRLASLLYGLARRLGIDAPPPALTAKEEAWVEEASAALEAHRGRGLVTCGAHLAPELQALMFGLNEKLGNLGVTVELTEPVTMVPRERFETLTTALRAGEVETLLVLDANPAYGVAGGLRFADAMERVPLRIHAGLYEDETAARSHWHVPLAHALESWGDTRAVDGTATILQPLIRRFYDVRTAAEILFLLLGDPNAKDRDFVRDTWRERWGEEGFETRWRKAVHDGFVAETVAPTVRVTSKPVSLPQIGEAKADTIEIVVRPDPTVWDGRFSNVAWLQELPKPITKVTWDNVVALDAGLARALGVGQGDHVEIATQAGRAIGPAWIMPGQAARTVTVYLGYGKSRGGSLERGIGYDANALRGRQADWTMTATLRRVAGRTKLATSQFHFALGGQDFVRVVSREQADIPQAPQPSETLYPDRAPGRPTWGMSIDLDCCIGCNACVVACQAENNVPIVGKDQVAMGREMHWLRVDRYYDGPIEDPAFYFQPVPCMHCEHAPCEMGCPVGATTHSPDGLNQMIYNRCIGTRTCSSYCPYKVRRFNWYDYTSDAAPGVIAQRNPDVTVRMRGVMEKCTYCIQRINAARIAAEKDGRPIRDGEIVTACQAACPTQVIVFGDVADSSSVVSRAKADPRDYSLLGELNTRPRTTYLARIIDVKPGKPQPS